MEILSKSSCDNKVGFCRQDRPIIRIVLSLGSSYNDKMLESAISDDKVSESASLDDEVLESDDEVEFL